MTEKIKTIDGQTLLEMELPPTRFIIENLLPQGLHILAGAPKTGKSWLLLQMSLKIAKGDLLWNLQTERSTVLSLCLDDSLSRIQQRMFELTDSAPPNIFFSTISKSLNDGLCEQIEYFISEHSDTGLVIIDTLQMVRTNSANANLYAADYKDIALLKQIADRYGIAIIVVQHLRKQHDSDPHAMISGSTGLLGAADGSYILMREKVGDREAKLYIKGRDVEEQVLTIKRDSETNEWIFVSSDLQNSNLISEDKIILQLTEFMKKEKEFCGTASELAEKISCDINGNVLSRKLKKFESKLKENGIEFIKSRTGERREILMIYFPDDDMTVKNLVDKQSVKYAQSVSPIEITA